MSNIRVRNLPGLRGATASVVTPEDLAIINAAYTRVPMGADELHARRAKVAHNQHDRTWERFPKAMLERFAETLPGKSLLPGHDTSALPLGRWYQADTRTRTEDFPVVSGGAKGVEIIPGMETQRTRVTWLEAAFYFIADPTTDGFRKNIDGGVYQDVSIGFSFDDIHCDLCKASYWRSDCPHLAGRTVEGGQIVTLTYAGDPKRYEARETSIVYLGAQQEAELMKSLRDGTTDPQALALTPWGTDPVALKLYEALARERTGARKDFAAFPSSSPLGEADPAGSDELAASDPTPTDPALAARNTGDDMDLIRKALGLAETADETQAAAAIKALTDGKAQANAREPLAVIGETAMADLQKQIADDAYAVTGEEDATLAECLKLLVQQGNHERLKAMAAQQAAAKLAKFPAGLSGDPTATGAATAPAALLPAEIRRLALAG